MKNKIFNGGFIRPKLYTDLLSRSFRMGKVGHKMVIFELKIRKYIFKAANHFKGAYSFDFELDFNEDDPGGIS